MATSSAILAESAGLLGPDDPPPYRVLNPGGSSHAVLICDHASNRIPKALGDLGLEPANRGLSPKDIDARTKEIFQPYHRSIAAVIGERRREGVPALISVHSFTHFMGGRERPWHIGVLSNRDRRIAEPLLGWLGANTKARLGDNKPYSGLDPYGYSIETHALPAGLPNVLLEIRQDLIRDPAGQAEWAAIIGDALEAVLADPATRTLYG